MIRQETLRAFGASTFESPAIALLTHWLKRIETGSLLVRFPSDNTISICQTASLRAEVEIHQPRELLKRVALRGAVGFAESYMVGEWDTPDLPALLKLLAANEQAILKKPYSSPGVLIDRIKHLFNANHKAGSRKNIEFHYDLGNDFYSLWLDNSMSYSAALFNDPGHIDGESMENAQHRKYQRILHLLNPTPGQHILEIGCGWGGFAEFAAARGFRVTGVTLSREQHAYATKRLVDAGVQELTDIRLQDYRDIDERFDHIISIEMLEAVGEQWWSRYFARLNECLKPGGRAALQVITIDEAVFPSYRKTPDFIQLYIFPGGMLPSKTHLREHGQAAGLDITDEATFASHYAATCQYWLQKFNKAEVQLLEDFDRTFLRRWRYYLAYCIAGFDLNSIDLVQICYEKPLVST